MLATQTLKNGNSVFIASPFIIYNLPNGTFKNLYFNFIIILSSISMQITFFAFSRRRWVKFPVPGPISKTISVGCIDDFSTILRKMSGLLRIC